jgi:hypothetical protein
VSVATAYFLSKRLEVDWHRRQDNDPGACRLNLGPSRQRRIAPLGNDDIGYIGTTASWYRAAPRGQDTDLIAKCYQLQAGFEKHGVYRGHAQVSRPRPSGVWSW